MKLFNKKSSEIEKENSTDTMAEKVIKTIERPRICCVDLNESVIKQLKDSNFNVYCGTFGDKIKVPNSSRRENHQALLNFDFPENLHEYDIFILDLDNFKTVDYKAEEHIRNNHTGKNALSLLSSYPETIFDPRPLSSFILNHRLNHIGDRKHLIIVFTTSSYDIEYETVKITERYAERQGTQRHHIYEFAGFTPLSESKTGKEMTVCNIREDLKKLFEANLSKTIYNQTFHHPANWDNNERVPDPSYVPLIKNSSGDIVSIGEFKENSTILYLPQIENKIEFLNTFLTRIAPDILPELFPFSTSFNWKNDSEYWLPRHKSLLKEKKAIEIEYEARLKSKEEEINENQNQFSFLHEIITETGGKLVDALIKYLKWLGFEKVKMVDEDSSSVLEEDIQVELDEGILIIECKGIGGTSTDADCSQISKIKHRRCKERNKFDVFALYIVNHQRYLPPIIRQNPPFTENQKQDAINDERGLLSTWQLFNLYFDIENGIIDKESVRKQLLKFGYIDFRPQNLTFIDEPKELFKNGSICIINIENTDLTLGEQILVEKNGKFYKNTISGIKVNDKAVSNIKTGEAGLQLELPIKKKSILWKITSR